MPSKKNNNKGQSARVISLNDKVFVYDEEDRSKFRKGKVFKIHSDKTYDLQFYTDETRETVYIECNIPLRRIEKPVYAVQATQDVIDNCQDRRLLITKGKHTGIDLTRDFLIPTHCGNCQKPFDKDARYPIVLSTCT